MKIVLFASFLVLIYSCSSNKTVNTKPKTLSTLPVSISTKTEIPGVDNGGSPFDRQEVVAKNAGPFVKRYLKVLATLSFSALKTYQDKYPNHMPFNEFYSREIVPGFEECMFQIVKVTPDPDVLNVSSEQIFRIRVLAHNDKIIFYDVSEQKNKKVKGKWEPYYQLMQLFSEQSEIIKLKQQFKNVFHQIMNERELFVSDFIFGSNCGADGSPTNGFTIVNTLVEKKDKNSLIKCLQSTNTEMQLYGYAGIMQLKNSGINISSSEQKMMNIIAAKKGVVNTCSGCSRQTETIKSVVKRIDQNKSY